MKKAFTHSGFFHADDVFSSALLHLIFQEIDIQWGRQIPDNFDGIVFDIGGGKFDLEFVQPIDRSDNTGEQNMLCSEMERAMPWKKAVCKSQVEFVIFPSNRGGYMVQAVPIEEHSPILKHPFPEQWRGKTSSQLYELTGIETFHFCHASGFICAVGTLEDARKVASMA